MIEVSVNGVKELVRDLRNLPDELNDDVINKLSQVGYDSMQKGAGRHTKTGALFQSIYNRPIKGGRSVGHDIGRTSVNWRGAPTSYSVFVVFGSRAHTITPKTKKALRWAGPNGFIFSKLVKHPGYRGDDYATKAKDLALAQLSRIVEKTLKDNL
jgi:hypothetical protein